MALLQNYVAFERDFESYLRIERIHIIYDKNENGDKQYKVELLIKRYSSNTTEHSFGFELVNLICGSTSELTLENYYNYLKTNIYQNTIDC